MTHENIVKCASCKSTLIQEELLSHQCFTLNIVEFMIDIDTDKYYLYDGKKCTTGFHQLNPNNGINSG